MVSMKKISIVTVTYNVSDSIIPTIESVKRLKTPDIEYVIIDGGSTDNTLSIFENYKDVIDILVSEKDQGIYDAMNKGIKKASGEWVIFQNAGDKLLNIPLRKLMSVEQNTAAVCGCVVDENGTLTSPRYDSSLYYGNKIPHQGLFYRRSFSPRFNIKYKIFADYALNLEMYQKNRKMILTDDVIAVHSLDGVSMNKKYVSETYKVLREQCGILYVLRLFLYWKTDGFKRFIMSHKSR